MRARVRVHVRRRARARVCVRACVSVVRTRDAYGDSGLIFRQVIFRLLCSMDPPTP